MNLTDTLGAAGISVSALIVFLILHVATWRIPNLQGKGYGLMLVLFALSYGGVVVLDRIVFDVAPSSHFWVSAPVYALLMMLYLHFYSGLLRSLSVRILGELVRVPHHLMTDEDLDRVYPHRALLEGRVRQMAGVGLLDERDGTYSCTDKGVKMAKGTLLLMKLFGRTKTG